MGIKGGNHENIYRNRTGTQFSIGHGSWRRHRQTGLPHRQQNGLAPLPLSKMTKAAIIVALAFAAASAYAQLDRAGNVLDDGGGSGDGITVVLAGIAIGSIIGMVWAKYQQSQGKSFATGGGAVIGGLIGMFAWPVISILAR